MITLQKFIDQNQDNVISVIFSNYLETINQTEFELVIKERLFFLHGFLLGLSYAEQLSDSEYTSLHNELRLVEFRRELELGMISHSLYEELCQDYSVED